MKTGDLGVFAVVIGAAACGSPDRRIDRNFPALAEHREEAESLDKVLHASRAEEPGWVTAQLGSWDCGSEYCAAGQAEILASGSSAYRCLDLAELDGKAKLVGTIQTNLSRKIQRGFDSMKIHRDQIRGITDEAFRVERITGIRVGEGYFRKVLRLVGDEPHAVFECFRSVSIGKISLQELVERESERARLGGGFRRELERSWDQFFKYDGTEETTGVPGEPPAATVAAIGESGTSDGGTGGARRDAAAEASRLPSAIEIPTVGPPTAQALDKIREGVVRVARAFQGVRYQFGGNLVESGRIDCSAFVRKVFGVFGIRLPRTSPEQYATSEAEDLGRAPASDLKPGDLVFFSGFRGEGQVSHVGIVTEGRQFISANGQAKRVQVDSLEDSYWAARYLGARRLVRSGIAVGGG